VVALCKFTSVMCSSLIIFDGKTLYPDEADGFIANSCFDSLMSLAVS